MHHHVAIVEEHPARGGDALAMQDAMAELHEVVTPAFSAPSTPAAIVSTCVVDEPVQRTK